MSPQSAAATASGPVLDSRRAAFALLGALIVAIVVAYHGAIVEMVRGWNESATYNHGWLIVPICAYLVWRRRSALAEVAVLPSVFGGIALAACVFAWLLGALADTLVVQQLAVIAMVAAAVWSVCGGACLRILAFPCAYLVFAAPFGEAFVEPLMQWTATATVALLRLSGIAVYRDGMMFSTVAGDFEVARACSGIRYLLASAAIGVLYAHLFLRSRAYRWSFAALAVGVPVIANAVRAWLIVAIAHASNMELATGVDHFVYGWVFFGVVMLGVLWIGERLRRREQRQQQSSPPSPPPPGRAASMAAVATAALGSMILVISGPLLAHRLESRIVAAPLDPLLVPVAADGWHGPLPAGSSWRPQFAGEPQVTRAEYRHPQHGTVVVAWIRYAQEEQDRELVGYGNRLADELAWRPLATHLVHEQGVPVLRATRFASVRERGQRLTVWSAYVLDRRVHVAPHAVKLYSALQRLRGASDAAAVIGLARSSFGTDEAADAALDEFVTRHLDALIACARTPAGAPPECRRAP